MRFDEGDVYTKLCRLDSDALDALDFGIIKMDLEGVVTGYNTAEADLAGLRPDQVLDRHFFTEVAPCTNNFMVSGRFEDEDELDETLDYTFTLRMKPTKVTLRLLKSERVGAQFLLVRRR